MTVSHSRHPHIPLSGEQKIADCIGIGLRALGWALAEDDRARRLLALTGLSPDDLRTRVHEPALLAAVIGFLEAHEADLIACAGALDVKPAALVHAREVLEA